MDRREFVVATAVTTASVALPKWMCTLTQGMKTAEPITAMSLTEAAAKLRTGKATSTELTKACLQQIEALDSGINSFITLTAESALEQARAADSELQTGKSRGPLHGIPIALKDLIDVAGVRTTAGSALYANNIAGKDAEVTRRLRAAGAVLLGKLNLHEFAYGGSGVISHYGPVKNPVNPQYITGGSSSGSAAALAANFCYGAIGSDTAGSIRLPAACCGIVGFKPTFGAVSTEGVVELSHSYDHVGPMARTVTDARAIWEVIRKTAHPVQQTAIRNIRVGVLRKFFFDELDPDVAAAMERAISRLREKYGVKVVEFPVDPDRAVQMRESWLYHEKWVQASPEKYDPQTLKRIQRGAEVSDHEYRQRLTVLRTTRAGVAEMFAHAQVDIVVTPTSPIPAPSFASVMGDPQILRDLELVMLRNTRPFNVWGTPAISVPCGATREGLPIGIQFAAAPGNDDFLLQFASDYEAS
jgi:aspartyl-tRNA(Asn)/glutamyl-tRNA(Gln) amidotransferase subunit A